MALIGTLAINMSVRTAAVVAGMKKASASVSAFGAKATAGVQSFGAGIAGTGRATANVVDQFYVKPFFRAAAAIGEVGKEVGKSFAFAGRGLSGPLAAGGGLFASMATGAARMGKALASGGITVGVKSFRMLSMAVGGTVSRLREATNALGHFAAMGGAVAAVGLWKLIKSGTSLAEQTDRARIVFGTTTAEMKDLEHQAGMMATAFGVSRTEFIASAAAFGQMFKSAGYTAKDAEAIGIHLNKLALDASSMVHVPVAEALEKLQSGLQGNIRPLRDLNVFINDAEVSTYAAAHGIGRLKEELTDNQKIQARLGLITERLAYAQGNLSKTATGAGNATRGLAGRVDNLGQEIGSALLLVAGPALNELNTGIQALSMTWTAMTKGVISDQVGVVGAVGETAQSMGWLQKSVGFVADAFQVLKIGFYAAQSFITAGIGRIVSGLAGLVGALDSVLMAVGGVKTGIGDFLQTYGNDLKQLSEKQYETFQAQLAAPAASEGVNAAFAAAQERIMAMRAEAMKPGVDVSKLKPTEVAKAAGEPKFASAAMVGSSEATNAMLRSRYGAGAGGKKPEEETAKNTRRLVQLFEKIGGAAAAGGLGQAQAQAFGGGALLAGNF